MLECKICGTKFNAVIERRYLARDNGKTMMHLTARCVVAR